MDSVDQPTCLVIDDEADIRQLIALAMRREGIACRTAGDLTEARAQLAAADADQIAFCLTDMRLPDGNGLDLLEEIRASRPDLPVAVITAHGQVDAAVRALKAGAFDFVSKPIEQAVLQRLVRDALNLHRVDSVPETPVADQARPAVSSGVSESSPLLGRSVPMQHLRASIAKVARSQAPVFVMGESGTGKELVARQIHAHSGRREGPFVPVNCGAIPAELMESELFGHRKGAFTGASQDAPGLFRTASGGTLFLDEVAELPLSLQVKLLRVLQERCVRPVGEMREIPVDVRIVSASHQDLAAAVREGRFRHDLFYRLNVIELRVPPLRERLEDLPELADHILTKLAIREGTEPHYLQSEALQWLAHHPFPGNVRELENILERAVALSDGIEIGPDQLSLPSAPAAEAMMAPVSAALAARISLPEPEDPAEAEEQRSVLAALETTRWNRTEAAKRLGMTLRQLRYRLAKWGVE